MRYISACGVSPCTLVLISESSQIFVNRCTGNIKQHTLCSEPNYVFFFPLCLFAVKYFCLIYYFFWREQ